MAVFQYFFSVLVLFFKNPGKIFFKNVENIKDVSSYYDSSNYDSFKNTAKGGLDIIYFLIQKIMFRYKLFLIRIYLKGNRVLDYGAGSGKFAAFLSKKNFNTSVVEPYNKEIKNRNIIPLNGNK